MSRRLRAGVRGWRGSPWFMVLAMALAFTPVASAQDARALARSADPLRLASGSIQSLVQQVSRSVVQVVVNGYQPLEANGRTEIALGRGGRSGPA